MKGACTLEEGDTLLVGDHHLYCMVEGDTLVITMVGGRGGGGGGGGGGGIPC